MTQAPILLTGASGHLGVAIARALLAAPDAPPVRLLVRSEAKVQQLIDLDPALACLAKAELVVGDFRDRALLARGLHGAGAVIHNLHTHEYWKGTEHIIDVNVEGARRLAEAAVEARVARMIYVGSYSVHFKTEGPSADDLRTMSARGASSQAKYVVQRVLEKASQDGACFRFDVVSPSYMMGPWQLDPTYFGILFHLVYLCRLKWALPGGVNLVDVRDVADAVVGCLDADQPQKILATGENLTFQQIFRSMNQAGSRPYDPKPIRPGLLRRLPRLRFFGDFGKYYFDRPHWVDQPSDLTGRRSSEETIADTVAFAGKNHMFDNRWQLVRWLVRRYI